MTDFNFGLLFKKYSIGEINQLPADTPEASCILWEHDIEFLPAIIWPLLLFTEDLQEAYFSQSFPQKILLAELNSEKEISKENQR